MTRTDTAYASTPMASESTRLSVRMTAALSAELKGTVASDLIADIVRTVLDERRQAVQDRAVESTMVEVRQRLQRFIRARACR